MRLIVDLNAISVFDQTARVPVVLGQTTCNRKPPKFGDAFSPQPVTKRVLEWMTCQ